MNESEEQIVSAEQTTRWRFFTKTTGAWDAMLAACESATSSIDLEQFIFLNDQVGEKFLNVCRAKAKQGVHVRLLCDAAGSFSFFTSSIVEEIIQDGVEVVFFNTFIPGAFHNHSLWFFRDHRKLLLIDKKVGFTGGICLSEEMKDWRDTHVEIEGEVVREMELAFDTMWRRAYKRQHRRKNILSEIKVGAQGFNYVTNSPLPRRRFLYRRLIEAVRSSKRYVFLTTPYFVPDNRFLRVLKLAKHRGVDVRVLIPEKSDHRLVDIGAQTFFHSLLKSGIRVYLYKGTMIHTKTAVIDEEWSTLGSMNFDNVSFKYNFEANIISGDKDFTEELTSHFTQDIQNAHELTLDEWEKRSYFRQFLELLVYPIRSLL